MSRTILAALLALLVVAHAVELSQTSEIELEANAEAEVELEAHHLKAYKCLVVSQSCRPIISVAGIAQVKVAMIMKGDKRASLLCSAHDAREAVCGHTVCKERVAGLATSFRSSFYSGRPNSGAQRSSCSAEWSKPAAPVAAAKRMIMGKRMNVGLPNPRVFPSANNNKRSAVKSFNSKKQSAEAKKQAIKSALKSNLKSAQIKLQSVKSFNSKKQPVKSSSSKKPQVWKRTALSSVAKLAQKDTKKALKAQKAALIAAATNPNDKKLQQKLKRARKAAAKAMKQAAVIVKEQRNIASQAFAKTRAAARKNPRNPALKRQARQAVTAAVSAAKQQVQVVASQVATAKKRLSEVKKAARQLPANKVLKGAVKAASALVQNRVAAAKKVRPHADAEVLAAAKTAVADNHAKRSAPKAWTATAKKAGVVAKKTVVAAKKAVAQVKQTAARVANLVKRSQPAAYKQTVKQTIKQTAKQTVKQTVKRSQPAIYKQTVKPTAKVSRRRQH